MVNLKVFSFRNFVSPSKRDLFWGTKFTLEEFYWDDGYPVDVNGELGRFLKSQPNIRAVLAAPLGSLDGHVPLLPKSQTYIGDTSSLKQLVITNSPEKLRWRGNPPDSSFTCQMTLKFLNKVRVLSMGGPRTRPWLPTLVHHLSSLEILHLTGLHDSCEAEYKFSVVDQLKNLRVLIWLPQTRIQSYAKDEQQKVVKHPAKRLEKLSARASSHINPKRSDLRVEANYNRDRVNAGSSDLATTIADAEEQMNELDSEISTLQKKLLKLQRKKTRLRAFMAYCSNINAPIACLPPETLLEIFAQLQPESGIYLGCRSLPRTRGPSVFQLSAVCFSWRNLLLSQPLLWSKVMLSLPHSESSVPIRTLDTTYNNALTRLNICYRRASDMLMSLVLESHGDPPGSGSLNALLRRLAFGPQRWGRVSIVDASLSVSHWMGHVGYSKLHALSICCGDGDDAALNRALLTLGFKAPQLASLSLEINAKNWANDAPGVTTLDLSLIPSQLTELNITVTQLSSGPRGAVLYNLVGQLSHISILKIHILGTAWQTTPPSTRQRNVFGLSSITLPTLTSLDLSWGPIGHVTSILFKFIPPNLRDLTLHISRVAGMDVFKELYEWSKHFSSSLESANLIWRGGSGGNILPLIDLWTELTHLELQGPGIKRVFELLTAKVSLTQFAHSRKLRTLDVHLREDGRKAFLTMMAARLSGDLPEEARLATVTIEATDPFIQSIRGPLLQLIRASGYSCCVQYKIDRAPWLRLGLDEPEALNPPTLSN
ncbi:hypothetical protein NP233_g163 [Leucocoprinus birnbaumii]|uniref:F-box domain-containing protein n=1 Tax=Leucocoprinus birnbaumii TaxID=56174 RepID=A0AAD5YW11_9AGAR|nr:hypothetical protein NP233_g163 [Leucocoprinus birnbaumii]